MPGRQTVFQRNVNNFSFRPGAKQGKMAAAMTVGLLIRAGWHDKNHLYLQSI
jgi:hypothetical protein